LPGIDLRGDGGYVVAPPSIHPLGAPYEWVDHTWDEDLPDMPSWLLQLASSGKDSNSGTVDISDRDLMPPERIPEGRRNTRSRVWPARSPGWFGGPSRQHCSANRTQCVLL
jgi:hypothetical protein